MDFRRSGQLDERRRRVLMDEIATPSGDTEKAQPTSAKGPVRAYNESVLSERQKRVSEFIPRRPFAVVATILLLLTTVAAIEALYIYTAPIGGHRVGRATVKTIQASSDHPFAALDLAARGNIGSWFSSLLFAAGTLAVLGLLSIRAHRVDDYRGRYRVWWWVAAALAWASLDAATGMHNALGHAVQLLAGDALPSGHRLMWLGLYGLVFGTLGMRAAVEIWSSSLAVVSVSCAALLYFAGIAMQLEVVALSGDIVLSTVIGSTLTLLAHVSLVSGVLLYARHVHLDAQGRLLVSADPVAKTKKKPKSKAKLAVVADDDEKDDKKPATPVKEKKEADKKEAAASAASTKAGPLAGLKFGASNSPQASASISNKTNTAPANSTANNVADDEEDEDDDEGERSSKAERRRLKKLARRDAGQQQRRAA